MSHTAETSKVSLEYLLEQGPLPAAQALRLTLGIAAAMRSRRETGTVPENETAADFEFGAGAHSAYTAPEVLAGSPANPQSSVYTIGAVLYRLLTGVAPIPGRSPADALEAAGVPPGLEALILRCLDPQPDGRWRDLRTVWMELKLLCADIDRLQAGGVGRRAAEVRLRERIDRLESAVEFRVAAVERTLASVEQALRETRDYVRTAFEFAEDRLRCQAVAIDKLQTATQRTDEFRDRLAAQGASIEALQAVTGRTDDLLERVVESIHSLQTFILERTGESDVE